VLRARRDEGAARRLPELRGDRDGHGRSVVQVRDLQMAGRPLRLVWRKRRYVCRDGDCATRTFTEESEFVEHGLARRAAREICRRVGEDGHSVAEVAREFGISWSRAMAAVRRHGTPLVEEPSRMDGVRSLGVDEHKMLSATRGTTPSTRRALSTSTEDGCSTSFLVGTPDAVVTVDHFHAIKLANEAINDVRRRVQNETLGHRGHRDDPLYRTRRLMTRGWERLARHERDRLFAALRASRRRGCRRHPREGTPPRGVRREVAPGGEAPPRGLLRPRRMGRGARAHPSREDGPFLGDRDLELPRPRRFERCDRGAEPHHREDPQDPPRVPQFPERPPAALAALRRRMEHSAHCENQRASPTPRRVEPGNERLVRRFMICSVN
jgi:transposase